MTFLPHPRSLATCATIFASLAQLHAAPDADAIRFFENKVRPLLAAECYECHGEEKSKGGLRADHIDFLLEGGDTGPALVAGKPGKSLLIEVVKRIDPDFAMPPKKELTPDQVAVLEQWVSMGAPWPEEKVTREKTDENGFTAEDKAWWAVQPLAQVSPPKAGKDWARNEIDQFVARRLEENDLQAADPAGAEELVRRIYFDLHGLPPTPTEVSNFATDFAADEDKAVADLVDRLLASPRYGERWGQHWLDVVRYAESDGYRADDYRPDSWRYRDYVIRSFNEDKPYDQFIREQLAADELAPHDPDKIIATAFLRLGIYEWNQRNARMQWDLIMTEMTNVTGEAFLGLGVGCAQCHDHKFDPILQKDYFALQAFLNSTWWPEDAPLGTPEQKENFAKQEAKWKAAAGELLAQLDEMKAPRIESFRKGVVKQFPEDVQSIYWKSAEERTAYEEQLAQLVQRQVDNRVRKADWAKEFGKNEDQKKRYEELTTELAKFDDLKPEPLPTGFITTDVSPDAATTRLKKRDEEVEVEPAFFTLLDEPAPSIQPTGSTTGRRTALANWIADESNPLSTRVIVNRIWQRHFVNGLVPTPNDFGRLGEEPSHPELLDWLTRKFLDGGWKMKPIHRLIMTSSTYRQTARREPTSVESMTDPRNRFLWRYPPHRLDSEQIRDAMLAASGELSHKEGGAAADGTSTVRSVYTKKRRNTKDPMMGGFDAPSGFSSAPTRVSTTTPNQSLLLVNGDWTLARAKAFANRLLGGKQEITADTIREGYRIAYGREPLTAEVEGALSFIGAQKAMVGAPAPPPAKFPNENGLRPIGQVFSKIEGPELGDQALWLQPGSRFERLQVQGLDLPEEGFTIEAIANLDNIHKDASVNTLASRWNGSQSSAGWTFGITSEKSRYEPRNFIMQLIGDDFQDNRIYEVVASDLRFPLSKPTYIAAAVSPKPSKDDVTKGFVDFYLKDLSDPKAPLQKVHVPHQIVGGLSPDDAVRALIGGRDQKGHLWDGQLARITISSGVLDEKQLLVNEGSGTRLIDFDFSKGTEAEPAPRTAWMKKPAPKGEPSVVSALTDFCQALITSNEFLYLH